MNVNKGNTRLAATQRTSPHTVGLSRESIIKAGLRDITQNNCDKGALKKSLVNTYTNFKREVGSSVQFTRVVSPEDKHLFVKEVLNVLGSNLDRDLSHVEIPNDKAFLVGLIDTVAAALTQDVPKLPVQAPSTPYEYRPDIRSVAVSPNESGVEGGAPLDRLIASLNATPTDSGVQRQLMDLFAGSEKLDIRQVNEATLSVFMSNIGECSAELQRAFVNAVSMQRFGNDGETLDMLLMYMPEFTDGEAEQSLANAIVDNCLGSPENGSGAFTAKTLSELVTDPTAQRTIARYIRDHYPGSNRVFKSGADRVVFKDPEAQRLFSEGKETKTSRPASPAESVSYSEADTRMSSPMSLPLSEEAVEKAFVPVSLTTPVYADTDPLILRSGEIATGMKHIFDIANTATLQSDLRMLVNGDVAKEREVALYIEENMGKLSLSMRAVLAESLPVFEDRYAKGVLFNSLILNDGFGEVVSTYEALASTMVSWVNFEPEEGDVDPWPVNNDVLLKLSENILSFMLRPEMAKDFVFVFAEMRNFSEAQVNVRKSIEDGVFDEKPAVLSELIHAISSWNDEGFEAVRAALQVRFLDKNTDVCVALDELVQWRNY